MNTVIIHTIEEWKSVFNSEIKGHKSLGFVPTMGALHIGHRSLLERSIEENDITVCSIFVNPTQFNDQKDLNNYPITLDDDIKLLKEIGCDYLFLPTEDLIYPDKYNYTVTEKNLSNRFCGAHRPGHFDGVLTVVLKLLNIIGCNSAYFGEKDWQQYKLINAMAKAFFLDCNIIPCPLVREDDGLAFSSRNKNLTPKDRATAPNLYKIISSKISLKEMEEKLTALGFIVDYIEEFEERILVAATLGSVRLIDNVKRIK